MPRRNNTGSGPLGCARQVVQVLEKGPGSLCYSSFSCSCFCAKLQPTSTQSQPNLNKLTAVQARPEQGRGGGWWSQTAEAAGGRGRWVDGGRQGRQWMAEMDGAGEWGLKFTLQFTLQFTF